MISQEDLLVLLLLLKVLLKLHDQKHSHPMVIHQSVEFKLLKQLEKQKKIRLFKSEK